MTEVEKRRLRLLEETRKSYSDNNTPPAVHPRYKSVYNSLYEEDEEESTNSTFGLRLAISILIFVLCFVLNYQNETIGNIDSQVIVQEIQREYLFR